MRFSTSMHCWMAAPGVKGGRAAKGGLKRPKWRMAPPDAGCRTALTSNITFCAGSAESGSDDEGDNTEVVMLPVSDGWPPPWT